MEVDKEVRRMVMESYELAKRLLTENLTTLKRLAQALLEKESLDGKEVDSLIVLSPTLTA